jgi:hypothetical protein
MQGDWDYSMQNEEDEDEQPQADHNGAEPSFQDILNCMFALLRT